MKAITGLLQLSTLITYFSHAVQAKEHAASEQMPLFFSNYQLETGNAQLGANQKQCKQLNYNGLTSACLQITLNHNAINMILNSENSSISLFDQDTELGNEILWVNARSNQTTNIPNYTYMMADIKTSSDRLGMLVYDNKYKLAMSVNQQGGALKIQPCPTAKSADCYVVVKFNTNAINQQDVPYSTNSSEVSLNATIDEADTQPNYFSLSFGYDQDTANSIGATNLLTNSALLTSLLNQAMINSNVPQIVVNLHNAYVYKGSVTGGNSVLAYFNGANRYGADIALLITSQLSYCGIANFYCNQYTSDALNSCPYFVLLAGCAEYSVAHEFAHLFGCGHDLANAPVTSFAYGHGYINAGANIRTIMAYPSGTTERIQYYSSPIIKSPAGAVIGNVGTADNRRVLIEQAATFAQKLHALTPAPQCPSAIMLSGVTSYSNPMHLQTISFHIAPAKRKIAPKLFVRLFSNDSQPLTFSFGPAKLAGGDSCDLQFINSKQVHIKVKNAKGKTKKNLDVYAKPGAIFTGDLSLAGNRNLLNVKCQF